MPSMQSLSELQTVEELSKVVSQISSPQFDATSVSTICATLSLLRTLTSKELSFLPASLVLVNSTLSSEREPSSQTQKYLENLTHEAHVTSALLSCSSVLAGRSSESDEYGDVGIYFGDVSLGKSKEQQVISLLGLEHWLHDTGKIIPMETSLHALPAGLTQIPRSECDSVRNCLDKMTSLISRLEQCFEFRLEGVGEEGHVIWFLVGKLTIGRERAWIGLVGAGTWSGE